MLIIAGSYSGVYAVYIYVNKQCTLHLLGITSQGMRQRSFICSFVFKPFPFHRLGLGSRAATIYRILLCYDKVVST